MRYSKWILLTSIELFSFSPFFWSLSTEGCSPCRTSSPLSPLLCLAKVQGVTLGHWLCLLFHSCLIPLHHELFMLFMLLCGWHWLILSIVCCECILLVMHSRVCFLHNVMVNSCEDSCAIPPRVLWSHCHCAVDGVAYPTVYIMWWKYGWCEAVPCDKWMKSSMLW